jgi:hypothetical protein
MPTIPKTLSASLGGLLPDHRGNATRRGALAARSEPPGWLPMPFRSLSDRIAAGTHPAGSQRPQQAIRSLTLATDAEIFSSPRALRAVHLLAQRCADRPRRWPGPCRPAMLEPPPPAVQETPRSENRVEGVARGVALAGYQRKAALISAKWQASSVIGHYLLAIV